MTDPKQIRQAAMERFRDVATKIFTQFPAARSVMVGFAQYWADEADDAVHSHLIASDRETPLWPHSCDSEENSWDEDFPRVAGEYCSTCAEKFPYLPGDANGDSIAGFETFCTEGGSQEAMPADNYTPYAIAHRRDGFVELEYVGSRLRTDHVPMIGDGHPDRAPWPDARAQTLFAQICAHPADDGPRHVLADHLLERDDPRGELLALDLAPTRDAAAHARRAAMLAEHLVEWIAPLGAVIPEDGARLARGFVSHVEIYTDDANAIERARGSEMWGTVESLRYLRGSMGVLDPAMIALRTVGVIDAGDLEVLVTASRPWAIETLEIELDDMADAARLGSARTLPALRHLILKGPAGAIAVLGAATWWSQLAKLTVLDDESQGVLDLPAVRALPAVAFGPSGEVGHPVGWHATHVRDSDRVEIELAGWSPLGSFTELEKVISRARTRASSVVLVPSRYFVPTDADRARAGL